MNRPLTVLVMMALLLGVTLQEGCSTSPQPDRKQSLMASTEPRPEATALLTPIRSTINVTQQEYQDALAKWQGHHVTEYAITLIDSSQMVIGGKMRLRFRADLGEPRLIEYTRLGQDQPQGIALGTLTLDEKNHLLGLGVDQMFSLIGELLNGKLAASSGPIFEYDVAFDPTLGYPSHIYSSVSARTDGPSVTECCISYEVLSLEILRSATPGMPSTGNSGP